MVLEVAMCQTRSAAVASEPREPSLPIFKAGPAGGRLRRPSWRRHDTTATGEPAWPFT
jgi:hypothetical protein